MQIEVIVEGKGSIHISQKGSMSRLDLTKLTGLAHALANSSQSGTKTANKVGFTSGSEEE